MYHTFLPYADRHRASSFLGGFLSPSDSVKSASNIETTLTQLHGPRIGRPSDRFGPPVVLFDRALARLKYDLEHLEELVPTPQNVDDAYGIVTTSTGFFETEDARGLSLRPYLEGLLGKADWERKTTGGTAKPGASWLEGIFTYILFELKNETGLSGDPFVQGLVVYGKIIEQKQVRKPPHKCSSAKMLHSTRNTSRGRTCLPSC